MIRADLIFSYWIFIWFVLYFAGFTTLNPSFLLIISMIYIVFTIYLFIYYYQISQYNVIKYVIINVILKSIPLLLLWYYNRINVNYTDIVFTALLFAVYNVYLYVNDTSLPQVYQDILRTYQNSQLNSEKRTIISRSYDYLYRNFISKS